MELKSDARQTTPSSPPLAGRKRGSWEWERASLASKTCEHCGATMRPYEYRRYPRWEMEHTFKKRRFCGKSCARKSENPMHDAAAREKMKTSLKRIGHQPSQRGGNGRPMPQAQAVLLELLGPAWHPEFVVRTGAKRGEGIPYCYKIDIADPVLRVAVEIDGGSHAGLERKEQDERKDAFLRQSGWRVLRLRNADVMSLCSISGSEKVTLHILLAAS